jgi:peptide deformylase
MLDILDDTHRILRAKCTPVPSPYTEEDKAKLKEMAEYLRLSQDEEYAKKNNVRAGVGLAAPQIGLDKRMFAIYLTDGDKTYQYGLINPQIVRTSVKRAYLQGGEGCLSVPEPHEGLVMRYYKVVMTAFDVFQDKEITVTAYGYLAIALQHEYDHLDGVLFYDHIDKKDPYKIDLNAVAC